MLQTSSKVTSTWKKVIEVSALNPNATHSQPNVPTLFLLIRKLIIINKDVFKWKRVVSLGFYHLSPENHMDGHKY